MVPGRVATRSARPDAGTTAMSPEVRPLRPDEAGDYVAFRLEMLREAPTAFASSPGNDFMGTAERVSAELAAGGDSVIFAAFDPEIVGAAGVFRDQRPKLRHKMCVWGVYVAPSHRGAGLGGRLLAAAIDHARSRCGVTSLFLGVTDESSAARRLYENAGFREWGAEPEAMLHEGRFLTEHHMHLSLEDP